MIKDQYIQEYVKNEELVGGVIECTLHTVPSIQTAERTVAEVTALISSS